ncbi:ATP-binding protein [Streptomyces sp. NPDC048362]|uniref:ATP-binding protein n=1 Tax=Streptomyces sp. NPDC048362 TaxID=3365539 RepID=UPI003712D4FC
MTEHGPVAWPPAPIRTERLVLRESEARDRTAFIKLSASPEVGTYVGGARPRDELERVVPEVPGRRPGLFVVELDGAMIGFIQLESLVTPVETIVSELVTNAIRHGDGPNRLRLIQHRVLTCEVSDSNTGQPRPRHPRTLDEHGRGLHLVAQLSRRWGSRYAMDGKIVWAEQDLPSTSGAR